MPGINVPQVSYGSDKNGLIWGYLFGADGPPKEIDSEAAAEWIGGAPASDQAAFLWLHFSLSNTAAERWICALENGQSAFAKVAVDTRTAQWLREDTTSTSTSTRRICHGSLAGAMTIQIVPSCCWRI